MIWEDVNVPIINSASPWVDTWFAFWKNRQVYKKEKENTIPPALELGKYPSWNNLRRQQKSIWNVSEKHLHQCIYKTMSLHLISTAKTHWGCTMRLDRGAAYLETRVGTEVNKYFQQNQRGVASVSFSGQSPFPWRGNSLQGHRWPIISQHSHLISHRWSAIPVRCFSKAGRVRALVKRSATMSPVGQ